MHLQSKSLCEDHTLCWYPNSNSVFFFFKCALKIDCSRFTVCMAGLCHSTHLLSSLGHPGETQLVGQHRCCDRGPVVASPAHQHHTQPGHTPLSAKCHLSGVRSHLFPTWSMDSLQGLCRWHIGLHADDLKRDRDSMETYHDFVPFSCHCCGVIGIVSHNVLICVPHIRAVDMDIHWHGCRVCK